MKLAVTYENGNIFQHFGHAQEFKIYEITNNKITNTEIISTNGSGHGALATLLNDLHVNILICGGIGAGAQQALANVGIKLFGGVSGNADAAAEAFLNNKLNYNPDVHCNHHNHGHNSHFCDEDKHGCHNNC